MSLQAHVAYWRESARKDMATARTLLTTDNRHWSLFFWHLVLEKILKALILSRNKKIPVTHNLVRLAEEAQITLTKKDRDSLKEITTFNLEARYDDYKFSFYKKATQTYAQKWITICENYFQTWETMV